MGIGLVIEVALRILRRHWPVLLALALLFAGPGALLTAATGMRFNSVASDVFPGLGDGLLGELPILTAAQLERLAGALGAFLLATLVAGVLGSIGAVAFASVVLADYSGGRDELAPALAACLRRAPGVLGFVVVTSLLVVLLSVAAILAMSLGFLLFPTGSVQAGGPGVFLALITGVALIVSLAYLTVRWALAFPAMAFEQAGWRRAMGRSWHLSGDNVWRVLFIVALAGVVTVFVAAFVSQMLAVAFDLLAVPAGLDATVAQSVAVALGTVLLAPLAPVLLAVLCLDLRVRRDVPTLAPAADGRATTQG
jgi:hypothetical protein